jgi:hypothetical protein
VIIESDSLELIQACNAVIEIWSPYSAIIAECFMLAHYSDEISFQHCPRDANQVSHQIARHSYIAKSAISLEGQLPEFIVSYVISCWY